MPAFIDVPDPQVSATATGRIRYDLRASPSESSSPRQPSPRQPTLLLLGGMTQTVSSWSGQLRPLSATRPVLAYEARGQGASELALQDVSLARHVQDAVSVLDALNIPLPVDVCGFSFGGRVALALAAQRPDVVGRLVLSGVGHGRSVLSQCIVSGWRAALRTGDLEALARISLADIVGPDYLEAHGALVEPMIKAVMQRNTHAGISALFRDTMTGPPAPGWATEALAAKVRCAALAIGGSQDRIAPPQEVRALATAMRASHKIFEGAGHTVPIEAAEPWRRVVLDFLDAATPTVMPGARDHGR